MTLSLDRFIQMKYANVDRYSIGDLAYYIHKLANLNSSADAITGRNNKKYQNIFFSLIFELIINSSTYSRFNQIKKFNQQAESKIQSFIFAGVTLKCKIICYISSRIYLLLLLFSLAYLLMIIFHCSLFHKAFCMPFKQNQNKNPSFYAFLHRKKKKIRNRKQRNNKNFLNNFCFFLSVSIFFFLALFLLGLYLCTLFTSRNKKTKSNQNKMKIFSIKTEMICKTKSKS